MITQSALQGADNSLLPDTGISYQIPPWPRTHPPPVNVPLEWPPSQIWILLCRNEHTDDVIQGRGRQETIPVSSDAGRLKELKNNII